MKKSNTRLKRAQNILKVTYDYKEVIHISLK